MKKSLLCLLAPTLLLGGLASCSGGGNSSDKVAITFGRQYDASLTAVSDHFDELSGLSSLNALVDDKKNFILLVYEKDSTCTCWASFSAKLDAYMKESNARIYGIQFSLVDGHEDDYGLRLSSGNSTLAIFKDGELKDQHVTVSTDEPFSEGDTLEDWMEERVTFSNFNYLSLSQLNDLFKGGAGEEFTVYFGRSTCGDCAYVENHLLKNMASTPLKNTLYALDCDVPGIRYDASGEYDQEQWVAFKDQYGLSLTNNATFGYGAGYVPSFIHYQPTSGTNYASAVLDMAVYLNDTIDTEKMEVSSSYYDGKRTNEFLNYVEEGTSKNLVGHIVDTSEVDENGNWKKDSAAIYHDPLLTAFINLYGGMID